MKEGVGVSGTSCFGRSRVGLVALVAVLGLMALGPATASANHFTGSTKTCAEQNPADQTFQCVLVIQFNRNIGTGGSTDKITLDIDSPVGAEVQTATRVGGTCPGTSTVTVKSATELEITPVPGPPGAGICTIILQETLTSDDFGQVCQELDLLSGFNFPLGRACAELKPPSVPTAKEQCKNEGFKVFTAGFKNQGDCVAFIETEGKNEPGKNLPTPNP